MAAINLLLFFAAGQPDLGGVDHHHMIARIQKRRVARLMLTHEHHGGLAGHPAQHRVLGIDQVPLALDPGWRWNCGFHVDRPSPCLFINHTSLGNEKAECQTAGGQW